MHFTTLGQQNPTPFWRNYVLQVLVIGYLVAFGTTAVLTVNGPNWLVENALSTLLIIILGVSYRQKPLGDLSYLMLTAFMLLHIYGAMNSYVENSLGLWLMRVLETDRNYYDRIVHFSLGFLASYALFDFGRSYLKLPYYWALLMPIELTLSVSAGFELVEWLWASTAYPELGPEYLGHQGDPWDAQKDMFIATVGAVLLMFVVWLSGIGRPKDVKPTTA